MPIKRNKNNGDFMSREMDERLRELEASISNVYEQATADATRRLETFMTQYEEQARAQYARMLEGEITEAEYRTWAERAILRRDYYRATVDNLTDVLVNADIAAVALVNDDLPYVLAQSFNFGQYVGHLIADREQIPNVSFQIYNAQAVQALIRDNPDLLPAVNIPEDERWNRTHINRELTQAIIGGDSIPRTAARLASVAHMDNNSAVRAARTSMTAAENYGRNESHRRITAQGINMVKRWSATYDSRTRATHRLLDNTTANKDGKFGEGILDALGEPLMEFPADPAGAAAERYNCRCRLNIVPPEYSREANAREYEQWLQNNYPEDYAKLNESKYFDRLRPSAEWHAQAQQEFERRVERLNSRNVSIPKILDEAAADRIRESYDFNVDDSAFIEQLGYTGGRNAALINTALRNNTVTPALQENIDFIDDHMRPLPLSVSTVRQINDLGGVVPDYANAYQAAIGLSSEEVYNAINTGDVSAIINKTRGIAIHSPAYTSVSYDAERNMQQGSPVRLELDVPAGTPALITGNRRESEMIIARGFNYEIISMRVEGRVLVVHCRGI